MTERATGGRLAVVGEAAQMKGTVELVYGARLGVRGVGFVRLPY